MQEPSQFQTTQNISSQSMVRYSACSVVNSGSSTPIREVIGVVKLMRDDGKQQTQMVHSLVADAFVRNNRGVREVVHIDGNRGNNHFKNLKYVLNAQKYWSRKKYEEALRQKRIEAATNAST
jgi:hypothetical protein